jgi:hypothetical protein
LSFEHFVPMIDIRAESSAKCGAGRLYCRFRPGRPPQQASSRRCGKRIRVVIDRESPWRQRTPVGTAADLDVAVVGGGISGVYSAWRIREAAQQSSDLVKSRPDGPLRIGLFE